jgi:glutathione synthase/RimK-type ligase-like ATP-grasp enzyme
MKQIIVTEKPENWKIATPDVVLLRPSEYINSEEYRKHKQYRVINLCKSYNYQKEGYYISLLAEARGHKPLPSTSTMMDFKLPGLAREDADDFDEVIQTAFDKIEEKQGIEFTIYLGKTASPEHAKVGHLLFNLYQMPLLRAIFTKKEKWQLRALKPLNMKDISADELPTMQDALGSFIEGKKVIPKSNKRRQYDLAILVNPSDPHPPSDSRALQRFVKAAVKVGFNTEFITKSDFARITQFDALFIRETTHVNNHTFRFARKAEYEGLAVIDDPTSMLKCTNKVYLNELLTSNGIACPRSVNLRKGDEIKLLPMGFPYVLKQPDGAFSIGVKKIANPEEQEHWLRTFFQETDLLIAQEFMPSDFDWRVGVLGGRVIYVCKYYMARNHWQIINWRAKGKGREGDAETLAVDKAPKKLLEMAEKACSLIGNGLYGVDIKEVNGNFYVIEINDNPNIDSGVEDKAHAGNSLYEAIVQHLMNEVQNG